MNLRSRLDAGQLLPPKDASTSDGLPMCNESPPLYHDLKSITYTAFDVREWSGKIKKYKAEVVAYAEKCRQLEEEVISLRKYLADRTERVKRLEGVNKADIYDTELESTIEEEKCKFRRNVTECNGLKLKLQMLQKFKFQTNVDSSETQLSTDRLKTEADIYKKKFNAALGEKERLKFERTWMFRQRLLLEQTTLEEVKDIALMKMKLDKLRMCLHKAWKDAKYLDILGRLRIGRQTAFSKDWFAARNRNVDILSTYPPKAQP